MSSVYEKYFSIIFIFFFFNFSPRISQPALLHSALYIPRLHSILTGHIPKLHTLHRTLPTPHSTPNILPFTLPRPTTLKTPCFRVHSALHTAHPHSIQFLRSLSIPHTLRFAPRTHTLHFTLPTPHPKFYTTYSTLHTLQPALHSLQSVVRMCKTV